MNYHNTKKGIFIERPNRFIAKVEIDGVRETVHVKNTGRCKELLIPGAEVMLQKADTPNRKTPYDLISVMKPGRGWINIDSQVPNKVVKEWLVSEVSPFRGITLLKPEYTYGNSRVDFYLECEDIYIENDFDRYADDQKTVHKVLIEVKGCTLERDGVGYFPDAPTERGVKHLRELTKAIAEGFECYVAFVIAMPGVERVYPNVDTHPEFAIALQEAQEMGVGVLHLLCDVQPDSLEINDLKIY